MWHLSLVIILVWFGLASGGDKKVEPLPCHSLTVVPPKSGTHRYVCSTPTDEHQGGDCTFVFEGPTDGRLEMRVHSVKYKRQHLKQDQVTSRSSCNKGKVAIYSYLSDGNLRLQKSYCPSARVPRMVRTDTNVGVVVSSLVNGSFSIEVTPTSHARGTGRTEDPNVQGDWITIVPPPPPPPLPTVDTADEGVEEDFAEAESSQIVRRYAPPWSPKYDFPVFTQSFDRMEPISCYYRFFDGMPTIVCPMAQTSRQLFRPSVPLNPRQSLPTEYGPPPFSQRPVLPTQQVWPPQQEWPTQQVYRPQQIPPPQQLWPTQQVYPPQQLWPTQQTFPPQQVGPTQQISLPQQEGPTQQIPPPQQQWPPQQTSPPQQLWPTQQMSPPQQVGPPQQRPPPQQVGPTQQRPPPQQVGSTQQRPPPQQLWPTQQMSPPQQVWPPQQLPPAGCFPPNCPYPGPPTKPIDLTTPPPESEFDLFNATGGNPNAALLQEPKPETNGSGHESNSETSEATTTLSPTTQSTVETTSEPLYTHVSLHTQLPNEDTSNSDLKF